MFRQFVSSFGSKNKPMSMVEFSWFWLSLPHAERTELWDQWVASSDAR